MSVGRSSRTPVKHYLLNAMVGKVCAVASLGNPRVPCRITDSQPMLMVDLCGGDGLSNEDHDASPHIMYGHCKWLADRGKASSLTVIEKMENTFEQLSENCSHFDPEIATLVKADSAEYRLPKLSPNQAAFVHCDPNTVDQIPLSEPFLSGFNPYTTYLVTLGCNVSGLKMLPAERRSRWFGYIEMLTKVLPRRHDAVLFWLNRDEAQWAYLMSIPNVWSQDFTRSAVKATAKKWTKGVNAVSFRGDRRGFEDQVARLFLTKDEYNGR